MIMVKNFIPELQQKKLPFIIKREFSEKHIEKLFCNHTASNEHKKFAFSGGPALSIHSISGAEVFERENVPVKGIFYDDAAAAGAAMLAGDTAVAMDGFGSLRRYGDKVKAIEYSAQREMSIKIFEQIENHTRTKFNLSSIQIFHSLGIVRIGEICLFASVSSKRRKNVQLAIKFLVEEIFFFLELVFYCLLLQTVLR